MALACPTTSSWSFIDLPEVVPPPFQDEGRFPQSQGVALDGRGGVGPQIPELGYQGFLEVGVEIG